jgi:hypothetical protein
VADRYFHEGREAFIFRNRPRMEFIFTCCPAAILLRRQRARLGESRDDDSESFSLKPIVTERIGTWTLSPVLAVRSIGRPRITPVTVPTSSAGGIA